MMSISPPVGQLLRFEVQNAGHEPQTLLLERLRNGRYALGRCSKSAMTRTSLKVSIDSNLTDCRPPEATLTESGAR